jgi:hypothetical protein
MIACGIPRLAILSGYSPVTVKPGRESSTMTSSPGQTGATHPARVKVFNSGNTDVKCAILKVQILILANAPALLTYTYISQLV